MCSTKTCNKCGDEKDVELFPKIGCVCKGCISVYNKIYRQENKEYIKEAQRNYRENNKEKRKTYNQNNRERVAETKKKWYEANKERLLNVFKEYRQDNKEKIAEVRKKFYQDNKEKIDKAHRKWLQDNPEKARKQALKNYYKHRDSWSLRKFLKARNLGKDDINPELLSAIMCVLKLKRQARQK